MRQFKNAFGRAGDGLHWHHIVEQNKVGQFAAEQVHNTANLIRVDAATHAKITGRYNSKLPGTSMTVRQWLSGQPWDVQYNYGLDVLREFGVIQ